MHPSVEHVDPGNGRPQVPLAAFRRSLERNRIRYTPIGIEQYITDVDNGFIPPPPRNSADTVMQALTQKKPFKTPAGHWEYPAFSARDDEFAVLGVTPSIEDYMRYITAESRFDTKDRVAVVVGPTGAAKSTVNKVILKELEQFTDRVDKPAVYGIDGCPINEDPLHVLDPETRELWKKEKNIDVRGELCPDCQGKADESIHRGHLGYASGTAIPLDFKVKPLQFSEKMQRGIGTIDPQTFLERNASELITRAVRSSNRGILYLAEMGRMDPSLLVGLNNLFRGRTFISEGRPYALDTLIIGEMTIEELSTLHDRAPRSLLERLDLIDITYPLDPIAEEKILGKRMRTSRLDTMPHISPRSLELIAEGAVRTRLVDYQEGDKVVMTVGEKAELYRGNNVNGFTQADRKKVEIAGRDQGEGEFGMSPPELWNVVFQEAAQQIAETRAEGSCLDFVGLKKRLDDHISTAELSDAERATYKHEFRAVAEKYDKWLLQTVEKAYQDRYTERADQAVNDYVNEVDYLLDARQVKIDPRTGEEVPVGIQFMTAFEDAISEKTLSNDDAKPNSRRGFRIRMQNVAGKVTREKKTQGQTEPTLSHSDFYTHIPGFEKGIKDFLKRQGLEDPKETLTSLTPNEEQSKKLLEMEGRLIVEHGFCECCAPKLRKYIRDLLRKGQV